MASRGRECLFCGKFALISDNLTFLTLWSALWSASRPGSSLRSGGGRRRVNPERLEFSVDRLGKGGFAETDYFGALHSKELFEICARIALNHRVLPEIRQYRFAAVLGKISGDQDEVKPLPGPTQGVAPDEERTGTEREREQPFDRAGIA